MRSNFIQTKQSGYIGICVSFFSHCLVHRKEIRTQLIKGYIRMRASLNQGRSYSL